MGSAYFIRETDGISIQVGEIQIMSVKSDSNLGVYFNECMSMDEFVKAKVTIFKAYSEKSTE